MSLKIDSNWVGGSCTTVGIGGLMYTESAEAAMLEFCKKGLLSNKPKRSFTTDVSKYNNLFAYYVFTAGSEGKKKAYATRFADYIVKNKLGRVVSPGRTRNRGNWGEDNLCQSWLWCPNKANLIKWFEKRT